MKSYVIFLGLAFSIGEAHAYFVHGVVGSGGVCEGTNFSIRCDDPSGRVECSGSRCTVWINGIQVQGTVRPNKGSQK